VRQRRPEHCSCAARLVASFVGPAAGRATIHKTVLGVPITIEAAVGSGAPVMIDMGPPLRMLGSGIHCPLRLLPAEHPVHGDAAPHQSFLFPTAYVRSSRSPGSPELTVLGNRRPHAYAPCVLRQLSIIRPSALPPGEQPAEMRQSFFLRRAKRTGAPFSRDKRAVVYQRARCSRPAPVSKPVHGSLRSSNWVRIRDAAAGRSGRAVSASHSSAPTEPILITSRLGVNISP